MNLGALFAGAKFRGQFEERVMNLIREAKRQNCILFLDDIHQIVAGSGARNTAMEASQFMKPALFNDEIQVIGATTTRRISELQLKRTHLSYGVSKLSDWKNLITMYSVQILREYKNALERFHHVVVSDESLETALLWVKVLLRDRALPDKVLDVLDRAAARVSIQRKTNAMSLPKHFGNSIRNQRCSIKPDECVRTRTLS